MGGRNQRTALAQWPGDFRARPTHPLGRCGGSFPAEACGRVSRLTVAWRRVVGASEEGEDRVPRAVLTP